MEKIITFTGYFEITGTGICPKGYNVIFLPFIFLLNFLLELTFIFLSKSKLNILYSYQL